MAGWIEDRWLRKTRDAKTGERERTELWGSKTKRYRVCGIPGVPKRSFDTAAAAKRWQKEAATDVSRGTFYDPRLGEMTLQEYVETHWWPNLRKPPTTKQSMKPRVFNHVLPHAGHLPLNRIGFDEVRAWQTRVEQDIDVGTLVVTWRHFSSIMQAAHKAKRIPANPFRDPDLLAPQPPKSKAKAWPLETVKAVRAGLSDRYQVLVDLAVGAGLRQGEALGFSPDDVDGEVLHVTRQIVLVGGKLAFAPPKGNKERDAPCPPELAEAIKAHADAYPTIDVTLPWVDPLRPSLSWDDRPKRTVRLLVTTTRVTGISGGAVNRTTFDDKQWKPALVRAGVLKPPVVELVQGKSKAPWKRVLWKMQREDGFHGLRHTFASVVLASGETITQLAAWLGHSDPAFTLRTYVHFMPSSGRRGVVALGEWLRSTSPLGAGPSLETPSQLPQGPPEPVEEGVSAGEVP